MKHFGALFTVLIILLVIGCQSDKNTQNKEVTPTAPEKPLLSELDTFYLGNTLVHVEKIKRSDFEAVASSTVIDTSETRNLIKDSAMATRLGDSLIIKTKFKIVPLVNNNNDEDDVDNFVNYRYYGFIKSMDQFLVAATYYEASDYILIDRQTAHITQLWGIPQVSPNGKLFIAGNTDLVAGFNYNGLQLFKTTHKPKLSAQRELQTWGPDEIKWLNNTTLLIKGSISDTTNENLERPEYFKLKFD